MPNHVWHDDDLRGAQFKRVDLSDAEFRDVNLTRARIVDAVLVDVELSGLITGMTVNDVEVAPLIQAELDRRHPERLLLRATTGPGLLEGVAAVEDLWRPTLELARSLRSEQFVSRDGAVTRILGGAARRARHRPRCFTIVRGGPRGTPQTDAETS